MEKNRLYIVIASVVAFIGIFLPWGNVSLGAFGGLNISGVQGDGWIIAILAGGVVALVTLKDRTQALAKSNATGVAVLGVLQTIIYYWTHKYGFWLWIWCFSRLWLNREFFGRNCNSSFRINGIIWW